MEMDAETTEAGKVPGNGYKLRAMWSIVKISFVILIAIGGWLARQWAESLSESDRRHDAQYEILNTRVQSIERNYAIIISQHDDMIRRLTRIEDKVDKR